MKPETPNLADKALPDASATVDVSVLSQWALIKARFQKHRLAVIALYLISLLYFLALFAGFFAPYSQFRRAAAYSYAPPQVPQFSLQEGFFVHALKSQNDPVTLKRTYTTDPTEKVPLGFLVKGEPYRIFWVLETQRRFFGVDLEAWSEGQTDPGSDPPSFHLLGADRYGRDILSRGLFGSRISLSIGLVSICITFLLGSLIGGISGYMGGTIDTLIQRLIEIINSFPHLPLWMAIAAIVPSDWPPLRIYFSITIVLSFLNWTGLARVVRGKILSLREEDYAVAARLLGASHGRVLFRHLLPGFTSHIIVTLTLSIPGMILGETALSFLGLGLRPPIVSWGVMLQDCLNLQVVADYPWHLMPVVTIIITVLSFNFLGDGLRDAADPYSTH
ncbi:MAG: ABC transporter permease [Verrucomicrobia bacterium]|nr:MAG: ABC transporter permease [Verrucomicrobiota bacterium]